MQGGRIERKLAAVLYADVCGYSRLTGQDEEGTHRTLSAFLDVIAQAVTVRGGRVVHYAGDAVLADFPSVLDAVLCAVDFQRDLTERNATVPEAQKLQFRVGINLGDVMVDRDDIYGDGVNVAARLEALADPGGICVSGAVYEQIKNRIDLPLVFLGMRSVKNIAEAVSAYRVVLGTQPASEPPRRRLLAGLKLPFLRRRDEAMPTERARPLRRKVLWAAILALAVGWAVFDPPIPVPFEGDPLPPVVVVMPFKVIGDAGKIDVFGEGLTEDLKTALAERTDLKVLAGSEDSADAAAVLSTSARYRLEGTVRQVGDRLRITSQLVGAETGFHLWGARYDRTFDRVLAVQDDVSAKIVAAAEVHLTLAEQERLAQKGGTETRVVAALIWGLEVIGLLGEQAVSAFGAVVDGITGAWGGGA